MSSRIVLGSFSIGSLVADAMSAAPLAVQAVGGDTMVSASVMTAAALLPAACLVAGAILYRLERPTAEVARQLAGFERDLRANPQRAGSRRW